MPLKEIRGLFPDGTFKRESITSQIDQNYNCVAWALGDTRTWWEPWGSILPTSFPPYQWPADLPHNTLSETYVRFFERHGFARAADAALEAGVEKIAIYIRDGQFRHVARQLETGLWTSKLGPQEDIEHTLSDLERPAGYGRAELFMRRARPL